jgi:hypothetical protein
MAATGASRTLTDLFFGAGITLGGWGHHINKT